MGPRHSSCRVAEIGDSGSASRRIRALTGQSPPRLTPNGQLPTSARVASDARVIRFGNATRRASHDLTNRLTLQFSRRLRGGSAGASYRFYPRPQLTTPPAAANDSTRVLASSSLRPRGKDFFRSLPVASRSALFAYPPSHPQLRLSNRQWAATGGPCILNSMSAVHICAQLGSSRYVIGLELESNEWERPE